MKKSLISFVVSILCLALLSSPTYALGDSINTNSVDVAAMVEEAYNAKYGFDNGVQPMQLDEVRIQKENAANDVYYRVLKILEANPSILDFYAGAFFDGENLVVRFNKINDQIQSLFEELDIKFEIADFSIKYLTDCYNSLDKIIKNHNTKNNLSFCIDEKKNAVVFSLTDEDNDIISSILKDAKNADCIIFEQDKPIKPYVEPWRPGRGIYVYSIVEVSGVYYLVPIGGYSTGYMASKGTNPGFVTSAHGNHYGDYVMISTLSSGSEFSAKLLGQITAREFSQYVDASFVQIDTSKYEQSHLVYWTSSQPGVTRPGTIMDAEVISVSSITTSTWIYKSGMATYLTIGNMISSSTSVYIPDYSLTITGLIKTDLVADHGDSGAVSYVIQGANYRGKALGIVEGGDGTYTYLVPATTINSRLGLTIN